MVAQFLEYLFKKVIEEFERDNPYYKASIERMRYGEDIGISVMYEDAYTERRTVARTYQIFELTQMSVGAFYTAIGSDLKKMKIQLGNANIQIKPTAPPIWIDEEAYTPEDYLVPMKIERTQSSFNPVWAEVERTPKPLRRGAFRIERSKETVDED